MSIKERNRSVSFYALMASLLIQGMSGIAGGIGLVGDPTGGNVKIPASWLQGSPFHDYLIPGLILLIVLGVFPLIVLFGLWRKLSWSWPASLLVGLALIIWIVVEIVIIGYHQKPPLQLIYGLLGMVMLVLALLLIKHQSQQSPHCAGQSLPHELVMRKPSRLWISQ